MLRSAHGYLMQLERKKEILKNQEERYKYLQFSNSWCNMGFLNIPEDDEEVIFRVSATEEKVLGFFRANRHRCDKDIITGIIAGNLNLDTISFTFIKDFESFMKLLLEERKFRKIFFNVVVGNPAERLYDRFIEKYNGRVIGYKLQEVKLDGRYHDLKMYELINPHYHD